MEKKGPAFDLLKRLLDRAPPGKPRQRAPSVPATQIPDYPFSDAGVRQSFHDVLVAAEKDGAVTLDWERYYEGSHLVRVRLRDRRALAGFIGIRLLEDQVADVMGRIVQTDLPSPVREILERIRERWLAGKTAYGLSVDDGQWLPDLVQALVFFETTPPVVPMDYRQFGARVLGDSKRIYRIEKPLAAVIRETRGFDGYDARDVLRQLNLVSLPQPLLIAGPLKIGPTRHPLAIAGHPYVGVPPEYLSQWELVNRPAYVLTIENLSSFYEYVALGEHEAVIIYTGGFPTRALQDFYRDMVSRLESPLYHWGDTDVAGFQILKCFQDAAGRPVRPHQMGILEGEELTRKECKALTGLRDLNADVAQIIERLVTTGKGRYEQEKLPAEPVRQQK